MKDFWAVWNIETGPPQYRHHTPGDAIREAERLARTNPGQHFYVVGTMGVAYCPAPPPIFTKSTANIDNPEIPF